MKDLVSRSGWRRVKRNGKNVVQMRVEDELFGTYSTFTVDELSDRVHALSLEEVHLEVETKSYSYGGGDYGSLTVRGWRNATQDEIDAAVNKINADQKVAAAWEEKRIQDLKRSRPELFK